MASRQLTPSDYGLKVRDSVQGMLVTAASKMRAGKRLRVGFAGTISETTVLPADDSTAERNCTVLREFVEALDSASNPHQRENAIVWERVPGSVVADGFFNRFNTAAAAYRVNAPTIAQFIHNRLENHELIEWTVALMSNPQGLVTFGRHEIGLTKRSLLDTEGAVDRLTRDGLYRIRRVLSPDDEAIDFTEEEKESLLEASRAAWRVNPGRRRTEPTAPMGPIIRRNRPAERGLLLIYVLEAPSEEHREAALPQVVLTSGPLVGFAVSFPASGNAPAMDYVVNQRFIDELLGAGDDEGDE